MFNTKVFNFKLVSTISKVFVFLFLFTSCKQELSSQLPTTGNGGGSSSAPSTGTGGNNSGTGNVDTVDATPLWETKVSTGKSWTAHVMNELDQLGTDLLDVKPSDSNLFCPNYQNLNQTERKIYWTFILSAMAKFESGFNTNSTYQEAFNDSSGKAVVSRGLLQISIESSQGYSCGFKLETELHDPLQNLSCGIRILNRWVGRDGRIAGQVNSTWQGGARYWSVLREGDKTSYKSILAWSQNLKMCQN